MSMLELHQAILAITGQRPEVIPLPDIVRYRLSWFDWLPGAPLTRDQWRMLQRTMCRRGARRGSKRSASSRPRSARSDTSGSAASAASSPGAETAHLTAAF